MMFRRLLACNFVLWVLNNDKDRIDRLLFVVWLLDRDPLGVLVSLLLHKSAFHNFVVKWEILNISWNYLCTFEYSCRRLTFKLHWIKVFTLVVDHYGLLSLFCKAFLESESKRE